ncbi:unnamed protein product, partial [Durusdinium trenchii]
GHGAAPVSDGENAKAEAKGKGKGPGKAAKGKGGMSYKEKQQAELAEKEESLSAPEGFTGKDPLSDWEIQVLHGATDQEEGPPLGEDGAGDAEIRVFRSKVHAQPWLLRLQEVWSSHLPGFGEVCSLTDLVLL